MKVSSIFFFLVTTSSCSYCCGGMIRNLLLGDNENIEFTFGNVVRRILWGRSQELKCDEATGLCVVGEVGNRIDPTEFVADYPHIFTEPPMNENVLCPFLRLMERYDFVNNTDGSQYFSIYQNVDGGVKMGQAAIGGLIPSVNSMMGQLSKGATIPGYVNYDKTHLAIGIAHECALTFEQGGQAISYHAINNSVALLREMEDEFGRVTLEDMNAVKHIICADQGIDMSLPGKFENSLTYSFLGGDELGYITTDDFERFMNGKFPMTMGFVCPFWGLPPFTVMCKVPPI